MWRHFLFRIKNLSKPMATLVILACLLAVFLVLLSLWFTFVPMRPQPLQDVTSKSLAHTDPETRIAPELPQASSVPETPMTSLAESFPEPEKPEIVAAEARQNLLDKVASIGEAPDVLEPDEVAFIEEQMAVEQVAPEDVVLSLSRHRKKRGPTFTEKAKAPRVEPSLNQTSLTTAKPSYTDLRFRLKSAIFPIGHLLEARLLSDIVAIQGLATVALVEVFTAAGKSLGVSLVNATLAPKGKALVHLEGNQIVDRANRSLRGNFLAVSPNGQVGLVGESKTYWLRHLGLTFYRTVLGILPLRLADQDNTLAGIIGAQAGTTILRDLSKDVQKAPERQTFLPRGTRFAILFTSPARRQGDDAEAMDPSQPNFAQATRQSNYLGRERERALFELANRFRELDQDQSDLNRQLGLDQVLSNPAGVLDTLNGGQ